VPPTLARAVPGYSASLLGSGPSGAMDGCADRGPVAGTHSSAPVRAPSFSPAHRRVRHSRKLCGVKAPCETPRYGIPVTAGVVLVLADCGLAELSHRHSESSPASPVALEQPSVPPAPKQVTQAQVELPTKVSNPEVIEEEPISEAPLPCLPPFIPRLRVRANK